MGKRKSLAMIAGVVFLCLWIVAVCPTGGAAADRAPVSGQPQPTAASGEIGRSEPELPSVAQESRRAEEASSSLLKRQPLGFDLSTIFRLLDGALALPAKMPAIMKHVRTQGRLLGLTGSLVVLVFLIVLFIAVFGQRKLLKRMEAMIEPLIHRAPDHYSPYFHSLAKILAASLIPLGLLGFYQIIRLFLLYEVFWLKLAGEYLLLWSLGALLVNTLRELLTRNLLPIQKEHGQPVFRALRIIILYLLVSLGVVYGLGVFRVPGDVIALLKFLISLSVVFSLLFLLLKKKALLGLLPELDYRSYQLFIRALERVYFPVILFTFVTGLLWCFGYHTLSNLLWQKTWAVAGAYVGIIICYHFVQKRFDQWVKSQELADEASVIFFHALRLLILYSAVAAVLIATLSLLGLLEPLRRAMSFPMVTIGATPLSLWILLKAALVVVAFFLLSRLVRAWLDYKIYPMVGMDEGLSYAINTFLNYFFLVSGLLIAMRTVGLDLRVLMVLAGAVGIGIGFGLQNMAANVFSSFSLVFGRRIKRGDWIQIGDKLGTVREVGLAATRVWTRDNIEYLIPNSDLTSHMIVNYSLSNPLIRIHIPLGVSYSSNTKEVTDILLKVAAQNPWVSKKTSPSVWFTEYGESSLNFELLVWIDVRRVSEREVSSELYYAIFQAFEEAGVVIPFPQRDLHIQPSPPASKPKPEK